MRTFHRKLLLEGKCIKTSGLCIIQQISWQIYTIKTSSDDILHTVAMHTSTKTDLTSEWVMHNFCHRAISLKYLSITIRIQNFYQCSWLSSILLKLTPSFPFFTFSVWLSLSAPLSLSEFLFLSARQILLPQFIMVVTHTILNISFTDKQYTVKCVPEIVSTTTS